jgi:peptide/nickel transport system permease protein
VRLVARRCAAAVPTLLGISLATFALVHLAPGDVTAGQGRGALRGGGLSEEAAENLRRTYGFDLPLFLNLDVQDRHRRVVRDLSALLEPAQAGQAQRRLVRAGTLAWPEVFDALAWLTAYEHGIARQPTTAPTTAGVEAGTRARFASRSVARARPRPPAGRNPRGPSSPGTAPWVAPARSQAPDRPWVGQALHERLRRIIHAHLRQLPLSAGRRQRLVRGPDRALLRWFRDREPEYRPGPMAEAVDRLLATGGAAAAQRRVLRLQKRAVPALMRRLRASGARQPSEAQRRILTRALADITGHVVIYDPQAPAAERRSVLGQWRDWWRAEETVYRDLSGWEHFTGALTRTRYARWLGRLATGDFGESSYYRRRAWDVIAERLPVTLGLNLAALLLAYLVAIPLGVWAAARRGRAVDWLVSGGLLLLYSLPVYWVGLMLVIYLGGIEGPAWFPTGGLHSFRPADYPAGSALLDLLWHAVLPVFCLGYAALAVVSRYQRAGMIEVLGQDYIRTARAKGLSERRVVWRHGLRNGVLPVINLLGMQIPYLLSGSVIVETIFDLPGLGSLLLLSIHQRDTNVLMGLLSLTAVLTLVGLLLADLLMLWADPRITLEPGGARVATGSRREGTP